MDIVLPSPVSANQLYGGGSKQRRFKTKKYKAWIASCPKLHKNHNFYEIELEYTFFFKTKRLADVGNFEKGVTDYLVAQGIIEDDNWQVVKKIVLIFGGIDKLNPRAEVKIRQYEQS